MLGLCVLRAVCPVPKSLNKKAEEDANFCIIKNYTFVPPFYLTDSTQGISEKAPS
jgi:hypothetical protein